MAVEHARNIGNNVQPPVLDREFNRAFVGTVGELLQYDDFITANGCMVNHAAKEGQNMPIRDYLLAQNAPLELINNVFTENGHIQPRDDQTDPYTLEGEALREFYSRNFREAYQLVQFSLDGISPDGFNDHSYDRHIAIVTRNAVTFLQLAQATRNDITPESFWIVETAAAAHDLGNQVSRKKHSQESTKIALALLPQLANDPYLLEQVRQCVVIHDEPELGKEIQRWQQERELTADEIVMEMSMRLSPQAMALILADKTDIGINRTSFKPQRASLDTDPHLEVNMLWNTTGLLFSDDQKKFTWELTYDPIPLAGQIHVYQRFAKESVAYNNLQRFYVSDDTHQKFRTQNIPYSETTQAKLWDIYFKRIKYTVMVGFALYPEMEEFEINMIDPIFQIAPPKDAQENRKTSHSFTRGSLESQFKEIEEYYMSQRSPHSLN